MNKNRRIKFNITPKNCKFIIKQDQGVIICILDGAKHLFLDFAESNFRGTPFDIFNRDIENFYTSLEMPDRFVGVAKCGPNDIWNEATGRLIAFSRMKDNLNKSFFKRAHKYIDTMDIYIDDAVTLINSIGEKLENNQRHRHNLINSILGDNEE